MIESGLQQYLNEVAVLSKNYKVELDGLHHDLLADNFKKRDFRAGERLLQVYIGSCIGLAKHWSKQINKPVTDAYQAFSHLAEAKQLAPEALHDWRSYVELRHSLVHDSLNVDLNIIADVIREQKYLDLQLFSQQAIEAIKQIATDS